MMIGTPTMGVMALMGIMPDAGNTLTSWHINATTAPASMVHGSNMLWLDELSSSRAICGTTSPINPIGPQNAVTVAVSSPAISNKLLRVCRRLTPNDSAYRLPSSSASSGLQSSIDHPIASNVTMANNGRLLLVTPEKLPSPQITYECTPSCVEKKLSSEMKLDARKLIMMPMISNIVPLRTRVEKSMRVASMAAAPTIAPARMLMYPPMVEPNSVPSSPPSKSITTATPKLEPDETPNIDGSASGLLKSVCISKPAMASAAPDSAAVATRGNLDCVMISSHTSLSLPVPDMIFHTSCRGMSTAPIVRFAAASTTAATHSAAITTPPRTLRPKI